MSRKDIIKYGVVISVVVAAALVWIGIGSKNRLPVNTVDSESSSVSDKVAKADSTLRQGGSGGGSSGKKSARKVSSSPVIPTYPQDLEAALLKAIDENDQEALARLLSQIREDRQKYADLIVRLALDDGMPTFVRVFMVSMMREMEDKASLAALLSLVDEVGESALRAEVIKALGVRPEMETEDRLRKISEDESDPARAMALSLLGGSRNAESRVALLDVIEGGSSVTPEELNAALYSMRHYRDAESVQTLIDVARDETQTPRIRATALYSLGVTGASDALPVIKENLDSSEREIRYSAALASVRVSDAELTSQLVGQLCDPGNYPHVRKAASVSLSRHGNADDLKALREVIHNTDGFGITLACEVFEAAGDSHCIPILKELAATSSDGFVLKKIESAIHSIAGGN